MSSQTPEARLPKVAKISSYDVEILPNLDDDTYRVWQTVHFELTDAGVDALILNGAPEFVFPEGYEVLGPEGGDDDDAVLHAGEPRHAEGERIEFPLGGAAAVAAGATSAPPPRLRIRFVADHAILPDMRGLYRASFRDSAGAVRRMAATHFEPVSARFAYVCHDEPDARAVWRFRIHVPPAPYVAVSNGPLEEVTPSDRREEGWRCFRFAPTAPTPPYLTTVLVGEFDEMSGSAQGGKTPVRVLCEAGQSDKCEFALRVAERAVDFFAVLFGEPYPLPKLDLIVVPNFPIGGMENWGAITLMPSCLVDPRDASRARLQKVCSLVAHEVAHNWFGNLVGIAWWDSLWLKEGFADWCAYEASEAFYPDWRFWDSWAAGKLFHALALDSWHATHAIQVQVSHPGEITELFDAVSYNKGTAAVRVMREFLGKDKFEAGLRLYMERHKFGNTVTSDLWRAMEESSGMSVVELMSGITEKEGYPLLHVGYEGEDAQGREWIRVRQERFLVSAKTGAYPDPPDTVWTVPLSAVTRHGQDMRISLLPTLTEREQTFALPAEKSQLCKLNARQVGIYRVAYDSVLWPRVVRATAAKSLSPIDRLGVVDDAFWAFFAGVLDAEPLMLLIREFQAEDDKFVLGKLRDHLSTARGMVADEHAGAFDEAARRVFRHAADRLGFESCGAEGEESAAEAQTRAAAWGASVAFGDVPATDAALKAFEGLVGDGKEPVSPDVRRIVLRAGVRRGGEDAWDAIWRLWDESERNPELRSHCVSALAATQDADHARHLLRTAIACERGFKSHDGGLVFAELAKSEAGGRILWQEMKAQWPSIDALWGRGQFTLQGIVASVTSTLKTVEAADDVESFFEAHPCAVAAMAIRRGIEGIRARAHCIKLRQEGLYRCCSISSAT